MTQNVGENALNRRSFLKVAATAVGGVSLGGIAAACGNQSAPAVIGKAQVSLRYWDWWATEAGFADSEIELFQKKYPGIRISKVTQMNNAYPSIIGKSVKTRQVPDVFMAPLDPPFPDQVEGKWLKELNGWTTSEWQSKFPKGSFKNANNMLNGNIYSAPVLGTAPWLQLYINNKVFRTAGLINGDGSIKIPRTWNDVTQACAAIKMKSNGSVYGLGFGNNTWPLTDWWMEVFVRAGGAVGGAYSPDYRVGKFTLASDRTYADFLNLFREWKQREYFYPNGLGIGDEAARVLFTKGKFGMTVGGVWNQTAWKQKGFTDFSLTTLVGPEEKRKGLFYNTGGGRFLAISPITEHPEESWLWFDWWAKKETGRRMVKNGIDISVYPENNSSNVVAGNRSFGQYVDTYKLSILGPEPKIVPIVDSLKPEHKLPMDKVVSGVFSGEIVDIDQTLRDAQAEQEMRLDTALKAAREKGHDITREDYRFSDWDPLKPYGGND